MVLTLQISPELQQRLAEAARVRGLPMDAYTLEVLERQLPSVARRKELVSLLQSWIDEPDASEQRATGEFLVKELDTDRLSDRKLYPPDLEEITW